MMRCGYIYSGIGFLPLPPSVFHIADIACITPLYSNIPDYIIVDEDKVQKDMMTFIFSLHNEP